MALHVTPCELSRLRELEKNYSNCIIFINDVCSYDKEVLAARTLLTEGGSICSIVQVLGDETGLPPEMAKRILWSLIRELEEKRKRIVEELTTEGHCSRDFVSIWTPRRRSQVGLSYGVGRRGGF
jgi:aristolochene synthase